MRSCKNAYLALTALDEYWDKDKHLVFLGDWCISNDTRKEVETLDYEVMEYLWKEKNTKEWDKIVSYTEQLIKRLIPEFKRELNRVNKAEENEKFYFFLHHRWLRGAILGWYEHYLLLKKAFSEYPEISCGFLDINVDYNVWKQKGWDESNRKYDYFHMYIFSKLLKVFYDKGYLAKNKINIYPTENICSQMQGLDNSKNKDSFSKNLIKKIYQIISQQCKILFLNFDMDECARKYRFHFLGKVGFFDQIENIQGYMRKEKTGRRKRDIFEIKLEPQNEFEEIFFQVLKDLMPVEYVEGWEYYVEIVKKYYKFQPRVIVTEGGSPDSTVGKIFCAQMYARGVEIRGRSHGISDTMFKCYGGLLGDSAATDKCYICGELIDANIGKYRRAPCYKLYRYHVFDRDEIHNNKIIAMITNGMYRYRKLEWPFYFHNESREKVFENRKVICKKLRSDLKEHLLIRMRDFEGLGEKERLQEVEPGLIWDDNEMKEHRLGFSETVDTSKIVICENITSAVFLEVLKRNHPIIVLEPYESSYLLPETKKYLNILKEVGIWLFDANEVVSFINQNYENIEDWWFEAERQKVIREVTDRFILNVESATEWWKDEIELMLQKI